MRTTRSRCSIGVNFICLGIGLSLALLIMPASLHAEERAKFGSTNISLKLGAIFFTDNPTANEQRLKDSGLYIGLEGYRGIRNNLYLGGEVGVAENLTLGTPTIRFAPIEINLKYTIEPVSNFIFDIGAGPSFNYASIRTNYIFADPSKENDWLMGGQLFADMFYKIHWFHIGMETKYQFTQSFKDLDFTFSNFRVVAGLGVNF